jgi:hypothetical protein
MMRRVIFAGVLTAALAQLTARAGDPVPAAAYRLELRGGLFPVVAGTPDKPYDVGLGARDVAVRGRFVYWVGVIRATDPKARVRARDFAGGDGLPVVFEFPAQDPTQPAVLARGYMRAEESGDELEGFVRVPEGARIGSVTVRAIWAGDRRLGVGSKTFVGVTVR